MLTPLIAAEPVVEVRDGEKVIFSWQAAPRSAKIGGKDVGFSAFVAELRTPPGFACTNTQPQTVSTSASRVSLSNWMWLF